MTARLIWLIFAVTAVTAVTASALPTSGSPGFDCAEDPEPSDATFNLDPTSGEPGSAFKAEISNAEAAKDAQEVEIIWDADANPDLLSEGFIPANETLVSIENVQVPEGAKEGQHVVRACWHNLDINAWFYEESHFTVLEPSSATPTPTQVSTPTVTPTPASTGSMTPTPTPTPTPTSGITPTPTPNLPPGVPSPSPPLTPTPEPTPTPAPWSTPAVVGDIDGDLDVDAVDALGVLKFTAGITSCDAPDIGLAGGPMELAPECPLWLAMSDINLDGALDVLDALNILRFIVGEPVICAIIDCLTPGEPPPAPTGTGDSLRIGTFNTQFLIEEAFLIAVGTSNPYEGSVGGDEAHRGRLIGERIIASGYDVIALDEVFDEDARSALISALAAEYPHFVAQLDCADDPVTCTLEDSGLMLFSRFPFQALVNNTWKGEDVTATNGAGGDWDEVAFLEYEDCEGDDCQVAKGVGMVRIVNPNTSRAYNVAFTHLEAQDKAVRALQLDDVERVITDTVDTALFDEVTFFIGDLNISAGSDEYSSELTGGFFGGTLVDGWSSYTLASDPGLTSPTGPGGNQAGEAQVPTKRIDYIFTGMPGDAPEEEPLCVQHMTVAYNLRDFAPFAPRGMADGGTTDLSDHLGVNADLNAPAPHCSPLFARDVVPSPSAHVPGHIVHPGGMQWFRVSEPGTYSIAMIGGDVSAVVCTEPDSASDPRCPQFHIYAPEDLSTPIAQWKSETTNVLDVTGQKFVLPEAPFYIRVFFPNRLSTGVYQLWVHQHECTSIDEACVLSPFSPRQMTLPASPINAEDTAWFEINLEATTNPDSRQQLRMYGEMYSPDSLELSLVEDDGSTPVSDTTSDGGPDPGGGGNFFSEIELQATGPKTVFLLAKRNDLALASYRIGWETDINIIHGDLAGVPGAVQFKAVCRETTDEDFITDNEDEIRFMRILIDGELVDIVHIGRDFVEPDPMTLEFLGPISFVDSLVLELNEDDEWPENPYEMIRFEIAPLSPGDPGPALGQDLIATIVGGGDGHWRLSFNISRSLPAP